MQMSHSTNVLSHYGFRKYLDPCDQIGAYYCYLVLCLKCLISFGCGFGFELFLGCFVRSNWVGMAGGGIIFRYSSEGHIYILWQNGLS